MTGSFDATTLPGDDHELLLGELPLDALGLNPHFLAERGVVPLEITGDTLRVAMADPGDQATLAALQFATGYRIVPEPIEPAEIALLAGPENIAPIVALPAGPVSTVAARPADSGSTSLAGRWAQWMAAGGEDDIVLGALGRMLGAGFAPAEAGEMLVRLEGEGERLHPEVRFVAARLLNGETLEAAIRAAPGQPAWLKRCLAEMPSQADQPRGLVRMLECEQAMIARRSMARRLMVESLVWAGLSVLAWQAVSLSAALVIAAMFLLPLAEIRRCIAQSAANPAVRCDVLDIVSIMANLRTPPTGAIRAGLARLEAIVPTWGRLPDSREELGQVLGLSPLHAALLGRGELDQAAARVSRLIAAGMEQRLQHWQWLTRCGGPILVAGAVVLLAA